MQIHLRKLKSLVSYAKNAKAHPPYQVDLIVESIKNFGFLVPLLISGEGEIIAGHGRKLAAEKLGITEVPCIIVDNLSNEQAIALRLADNKVTESSWLEDVLAEELMALTSGDYGSQFTGFSTEELEKILLAPTPGLDTVDSFASNSDALSDEGSDAPHDTQRFPLAIVLDWAQMKKWQALKKQYGMSKDNDVFIKIINTIVFC